MTFALLTADGVFFLFRWLHIFFGVVWIGLLYYFNFVQGPFFAETDAATKSNAIQKLVPRALWWFRWSAMFTLITGLIMYGYLQMSMGPAFFTVSRGIAITIGVTMAFFMWFNVWFVIWPNQKIVIASATQAASGGKAIPEAAAAGARAGIASRTNVLFSVPMLFFMAAASHLPMDVHPDSPKWLLTLIFALIIGGIEANALKGKMGPMASVKGVIHLGFVLTLVMYVLMQVIL